MVSFNQTSTLVLNNHISVKSAATFSGYSLQYLRRLLRTGKLAGLKIGQLWLIEIAAFEIYLEKAAETADRPLEIVEKLNSLVKFFSNPKMIWGIIVVEKINENSKCFRSQRIFRFNIVYNG